MTKHDIDMDELDNSPSIYHDFLFVFFVLLLEVVKVVVIILAIIGGLLYLASLLGGVV